MFAKWGQDFQMAHLVLQFQAGRNGKFKLSGCHLNVRLKRFITPIRTATEIRPVKSLVFELTLFLLNNETSIIINNTNDRKYSIKLGYGT